jgi:hypothetical protein|uniref:Uncharacterized protein n=1 Tax=Zea mays TaxID=4577 RepID=B4FS83_MAIZE|nr:unknown [Zea mays]ACF86532.1 unknown [Zea mays]|eukprot:NP_001141517.1 uncharacterized protein LOC100273629 [Zea mays]
MRVRLTELEREQGLMKQQGRMRGGDGGGGEHDRAFLASLSRGIGSITMFGGPAAADRRRKNCGGRSSQCSDGKARRRQKASFPMTDASLLASTVEARQAVIVDGCGLSVWRIGRS